MDFGARLAEWYQKNKRELPWRDTRDPYLIWLSEIILQQTRVNQGLSYYLKFIDKYPDVFKLANAKRDEVFKLWQGLGYYNRAENMLATAKLIVDEYNGHFPTDPKLLLKLPGIGPYTTAAVASIAFNIPLPVIDGNVYRVLSRVFGIREIVYSTKGNQIFNKYAEELIDTKKPGIYNQAIMEFGALHCTPNNPKCNSCIFKNECFAYSRGLVKELPVKKAKAKTKNRFFYYFMVEIGNQGKDKIYLKKRVHGDIWKNLYDFLLVESDKKLILNEELISTLLKDNFNIKRAVIKKLTKEYIHKLTHQVIHAVFIVVFVNKKIDTTSENLVILANKNELVNYPVPRLIEQFLTDYKVL